MKAIASTAAIALALTAAPALAETWDMPMAYADSNYHTENGKAFAKDVEECTGGELKITVHGGGSLYGGGEIKRAVQTGQAPIGERLLSAHANEDAVFGFDSVPFLASSFEASEELMKAAKPHIEEALKGQNLVPLYSVPWPPQGLYVNKEVSSVDGLEGLKFRAYNNATARLAELAEMQPVQIEAAELSQALATGVAEAFISSGSTGFDRKVWEHLSHFYDTKAWLPRNYVFVNQGAYDGLSDEIRECLEDSATKAEERGLSKAEELSDYYLEQLEKNGMTVQEPPEQLKTDLKEIGDTMAKEWAEEAGEAGEAILDEYRGSSS